MGWTRTAPNMGLVYRHVLWERQLGHSRSLVSKATIGMFLEKTLTCAPTQGHERHSGDCVRV